MVAPVQEINNSNMVFTNSEGTTHRSLRDQTQSKMWSHHLNLYCFDVKTLILFIRLTASVRVDVVFGHVNIFNMDSHFDSKKFILEIQNQPAI